MANQELLLCIGGKGDFAIRFARVNTIESKNLLKGEGLEKNENKIAFSIRDAQRT